MKSETFAVDWIQLHGDQPFTGDGSSPGQWFGHAAGVVAAADGTVVAVRDGLPEQPPNSLPAGIDPTQSAGNHVIVQIRPDTWALYAHLQPGSIAVAVGDELVAGQPLGRLGNSGNSLAPHLHFGLLDGPDPEQREQRAVRPGPLHGAGAVDAASYLRCVRRHRSAAAAHRHHPRGPGRHAAAQPRRHRPPMTPQGVSICSR